MTDKINIKCKLCEDRGVIRYEREIDGKIKNKYRYCMSCKMGIVEKTRDMMNSGKLYNFAENMVDNNEY